MSQREYCPGSTNPPAPGTERGKSYRTGECQVCGERFSLYAGSGGVYQHREKLATAPARDRVHTEKAAK